MPKDYSRTQRVADYLRRELAEVIQLELHDPRIGMLSITVYRSKPVRVLRDNVVIFEGELESLRRFKDDAMEVRNGVECGIGVKNYTDVKVGDLIEVFDVKEIARSL